MSAEECDEEDFVLTETELDDLLEFYGEQNTDDD